MDKSQREKESLCNFGVNAPEGGGFKHFTEIDKKQESYYIPKSEGGYLTEYDFETLPELKKMLDGLWNVKPHLQEIMKVVLVAAMKNKPLEMNKGILEEKLESGGQNSHTSDKLPAFIYNF